MHAPRLIHLAMFAALAASAHGDGVADLTGHWEGRATKDGRTFALALDFDPKAHATTAYVDYGDFQLYGVPFAVSRCGASICIERRPPGGPVSTFKGSLAGDRLSGLFDGATTTGAAFELKRTSRQARTLREETVAFRNGQVTLAGTLLLPEGPGPFAAVVLTHGSGPDHRGLAAYRGHGVLFARRGVAALIYDKRGTGESTGDYTIASLDDLADDALAGAANIATRRDIRKGRIGIEGHSQGGWIAPLAATKSAAVAFIVTSSASGLGPMAQSIYHNSNAMRAAGRSEAEIARAQALRERMYQRAHTGKVDDLFLRDLEAASKEPWFEASELPFPFAPDLADGARQLLLFEPLPVWRKVRVPVLAVWGSEDINLPAQKSQEMIAAALHEAGNSRATLRVFAGLNHGLKRDTKGGAWDFPRGEPAYERLFASWIEKTGLARIDTAKR